MSISYELNTRQIYCQKGAYLEQDLKEITIKITKRQE